MCVGPLYSGERRRGGSTPAASPLDPFGIRGIATPPSGPAQDSGPGGAIPLGPRISNGAGGGGSRRASPSGIRPMDTRPWIPANDARIM